jgi:FixJ family two-component response regulator
MSNMDDIDELWASAALKRALARLRDEQARNGKAALFEALCEKLMDDVNGPPLREVAAAVGMSEGAVKVTRHRLRRRMAELVREEVQPLSRDEA